MQKSFFDSLSEDELPDLYVVLEIWLRGLRDVSGQDYHSCWGVDESRSVVSFNNTEMDWETRNQLKESVSLILTEWGNAGLELKRLTPPISEIPVGRSGCHFEFEVANPGIWADRSPPNKELFQVLRDWGNIIGRGLYNNRSSVTYPQPLIWESFPVSWLPGVWVSLKPCAGRTYPCLNNGFQGHFQEEVALIEKAFSKPQFSLIRTVEDSGIVWALFDYRPEEINV